MSDIGPGDVVMCVHLHPYGTRYDDSLSRLSVGSHYRVAAVSGNSLLLTAPRSTCPSGMWRASHFRKIKKADEDFTTWARSLTPKPKLVKHRRSAPLIIRIAKGDFE